MDNYYDNNNFDLAQFNNRFEQMQNDKKEQENLKKNQYLNSLEEVEVKQKKIHELTIKEILVITKNEVLDLTYEIISFDYDGFDEFFGLFTKNNRLFYVGIFLLLVSLVLYLISFVFFYPSDVQRNDININIPNDYNLNYKPYEVQKNDQTIEIEKLKEEINTLKNTNANANANANTNANASLPKSGLESL